MKSLQTIRAQALALRSTIHNEQQLSAIELCAMVAKKTNEMIDTINEIIDYTEGLTSAVNLEYNEETERLEIKGG